jgi:hypothetical protein
MLSRLPFKIIVVSLGIGCALVTLIHGKGNQEILALPLGFWLGVESHPLFDTQAILDQCLTKKARLPRWQI